MALDQSETLVLLAIADHADDRGHCWPSVDRIAAKARISARQTQRVISRLEAAGYLQIDRPKTGRTHTNRYTVTIKGDKMTPFQKEGRHASQERVTFSPGKGDTAMSPESSGTIKNLKKEALKTPSEEKAANPERVREIVAGIRKRFGRT